MKLEPDAKEGAMEGQTSSQATATVPFEYDKQLVIAVPVTDLERSIAWYRDALGFELVYKLEQYGWCEMSTPWSGIYIGLGQEEEPKAGGTPPPLGVHALARPPPPPHPTRTAPPP